MKQIEICLLAALAACRSGPQTLAPRNVAEISPSSGNVSAKLVPDPGSPELRLAPGEEYVAPQLMPGNPNPKYAPELVGLHLPPHVVSIRVRFGEDARPEDIGPSPVGETSHDKYEPAFEAAVRNAVERWKCWPARIRKFRDGPDLDGDGKPDYRILVSQRMLKTFFDVSFTFEVVNGQPVVRSGQ